MDEDQVRAALAGLEVDVAQAEDAWLDAVPMLAALDAVGRDGASALIKIDGQRSGARMYTVLISGGRLGDAHVRRDGAALAPLLREVLGLYAARIAGT
jgi:hypothetical protein